MAEQSQSVEMVRERGEEPLFDREEVMGRDSASVFPTSGKPAAAQESLTKSRFVTEAEVQELQAARKGPEQPENMKPLVEVLREAKEAKEAAFQEVWKSMKTGKNRPLEEDEAEFLGALRSRERSRDEAAAAEDGAALTAFREAVRQRQELAGEKEERGREGAATTREAQPPGGNSHPPGAAAKPAPAARKRPALPLAVARSRGAPQGQQGAPPGGQQGGPPQGQQQAGPAAKVQRAQQEGEGPDSKRPRVEGGSQDSPALGDMLGGYASDDEGSASVGS